MSINFDLPANVKAMLADPSDEIILCITKEAGMRVVADNSELPFVDKLIKELKNVHAFSRKYLDKCDNGVNEAGEKLPVGDDNYWQLLPYQVFRSEGKPFVYQRTKLVGEARLSGNTSIGIGGHVNVNHAVVEGYCYVGFDAPAFEDPEDFEAALRYSVIREVEEEIGYDLSIQGDFHYPDICTLAEPEMPWQQEGGFLVDHSNAVGKLHLGLIYFIDSPAPVRCLEEELLSIGHRTPEELLAMETHENWTKIILGMPL